MQNSQIGTACVFFSRSPADDKLGGGYYQKKALESSASVKSYKPITAQQLPKFAGTQGLDFAVVGVPWDGAT